MHPLFKRKSLNVGGSSGGWPTWSGAAARNSHSQAREASWSTMWCARRSSASATRMSSEGFQSRVLAEERVGLRATEKAWNARASNSPCGGQQRVDRRGGARARTMACALVLQVLRNSIREGGSLGNAPVVVVLNVQSRRLAVYLHQHRWLPSTGA